MPDHEFSELQSHLAKKGVASLHIARMLTELQDHYDDLFIEAQQRGMSCHEAAQHAKEQIGDQRLLADRISSSGNAYRPAAWLAGVYLPLACSFLTPSAAGTAAGAMVMRWGASFMLGALVTAGILLAMQLSIALT